ncbi:short-chain fatty acid transporter [Paraburkholderia metrosideri]|uniref:Short-chain fatty acid transporter n=1 Tax=Paraburkholderia metrosideri TaxID=580937 RepID=A0ABM8NXG4_9BURK|nr:TIGR00366 family protein [Paraburkholderia metrosideri]CAD6548106.1 Putative short-chain fatty acid transporter [Paraburkholderia metrosideri]
MEKASAAASSIDRPVRSCGLRGLTRVCVVLVEKVMPDPFVIAILLTLTTCILAMAIAPHGDLGTIVTSWYDGVFKIASFAFLVALTLVTGHALSTSKPVAMLLRRVASIPTTAVGAMTLTFFVSMVGGLLNWAVGLVVSALFAREVAKRVKVDFAWLVAAAYAGWSLYVCGLSSSIALLSATQGSPLNVIEKVTGSVLPMTDFLFSPLNFVPVIALAVLIPLVFRVMKPRDSETIAADPKRLIQEDTVEVSSKRPNTIAGWLDNGWVLNLILVALGLGYIVKKLVAGSFTMDLNMLVMIFLMLGLVTHWTPRAYLTAINNAARVAGPVLLQFPIYGGIMGVMTVTGLADVIAQWFISFSTTHTLPFWSFVSSVLISMFVPSAGGHWIVQAPFVVPAAQHLGVSQHAVAISVALGEGVADMIQPMWVIPLLAIAGVGMGRVMGFTVIIFFAMFAVMGATLLLL